MNRSGKLTSCFVPLRNDQLPPLNAVRAFEAAARHGSFKEAAAELGVTHGAVSRQVHLLEEWLGRPALFRRLEPGRGADAGWRAPCWPSSAPALDRISLAARQHRDRRGEPAATVLRVNALATFSLRWLLPRLTLFRSGTSRHRGAADHLQRSGRCATGRL